MSQIPLGISAFKKPDGTTGTSYLQSVVAMPAESFDADEYISLLMSRQDVLPESYIAKQIAWAELVYEARGATVGGC